MEKGVKIASWIVAIATVVLCNATFILLFGLGIAQETSGVAAYSAEMIFEAAGPMLSLVIPVLLLASLVLGIVAAASKRPATIVETRRLMLLFKIGLIPFFLVGGLMEMLFFLLGLHPVLPFIGWGMGIMLAVMGWFTMLSGSIWAIATAVHLRRQNIIGAGELAAHIVLQLMFVADVIDAVILFIRSRDTALAWRQALTASQS